MGLSRTVSEIDGDCSRESQIFPTLRVFYATADGNWEGDENQNDGATEPRKKIDDIFSRIAKIHERDGQTDGRKDGQTPGNSKDRAYALRRAVTKCVCCVACAAYTACSKCACWGHSALGSTPVTGSYI